MAIALLLAIRRRVPLIASVLILAVVGLIWNWAIPGNWSCGVFIEYWVHFALRSGLFFYSLSIYGEACSLHIRSLDHAIGDGLRGTHAALAWFSRE